MQTPLTLDDDKQEKRNEYRKRRASVEAEKRKQSAQALVEIAKSQIEADHPDLRANEKHAAKIIGGYYPSKDEIDVLPLMKALEDIGHSLALPVIRAKATPLFFRAWQSGQQVIPGTFNVPVPSEENEEVKPDIFLVPMLAFDTKGFRLGYGGGFYDRTLQQARADRDVIAIGVAFDCQAADTIPRDQYDQRLDWMLTPSGFQRFTRSSKEG